MTPPSTSELQTPETTTAAPGRPGREAGPSLAARIGAIGGIAAAIVLVAALMFGSAGGDYRVSAVFDNAGQLVVGNHVEVAGTPIGEVTGIELTDDGRARVEMELEGDLVPLHRGTSATIRATSLSGIANRYVSLDPGPNSAPEIPDGGEIEAARATAPVDLDQLFDTLDPDTRRGLQRIVRGFAAQYEGKGEDARESLRYLAPALSTTAAVMRELSRDRGELEGLVADTARLVTAAAERRDQLAALVDNTAATAAAIGDENAALGAALETLPTTLRKANTTFVNLRATLDDLDVLVAEAKPATRDLPRFFGELRPLVADAEPVVADLSAVVRRPGAGNDLVELLRAAPRLADLAGTAWPRAIRAMQRAQPVLEYARPYTPDLAGFLTKFGQGASYYDANGHYARVQPIFNAFTVDDRPGGPVLAPVPPEQRLAEVERGTSQRCPGGALPLLADGSAPWRPSDDFDCDPGSSPGTP